MTAHHIFVSGGATNRTDFTKPRVSIRLSRRRKRKIGSGFVFYRHGAPDGAWEMPASTRLEAGARRRWRLKDGQPAKGIGKVLAQLKRFVECSREID